MNTSTILVWFVVSTGGYGGGNAAYSPPVADLASCQRIQAIIAKRVATSACVEAHIPIVTLPINRPTLPSK